MPYIADHARRTGLDLLMDPRNPGELNYVITQTALSYLEDRGESYATINEVIGALECAKLEFYRRLVAPYEDEKIKANGDVYPEQP